MKAQMRSKLVVCTLITGLLSIQSANAAAGRSVRSDSSDGSFELFGAFWGTNNLPFEDTIQGPGFDFGVTEFKLRLNPSAAANFFRVCMSEDGFLRLIGVSAACTDAHYALPPAKNYIAVYATDLDSFTGIGLVHARGFVDQFTPYKLWQAKPAMRYWWSGVSLVGDPSSFIDVQIVLIDRSNGTNNGNFDIEFNYGNGEEIPANGFQGFKLGPNSMGPIAGPFGPFLASGNPIRFCFRGGSLQVTCN
jgi:hypothetical protein